MLANRLVRDLHEGAIAQGLPTFDPQQDLISVLHFGLVEHTIYKPEELKGVDLSRSEIHPIRLAMVHPRDADIRDCVWPKHTYEYTFLYSLAQRLVIRFLPELKNQNVNRTFLIIIGDKRANGENSSAEQNTLKKYSDAKQFEKARAEIEDVEESYRFKLLQQPLRSSVPTNSSFAIDAYEVIPIAWVAGLQKLAKSPPLRIIGPEVREESKPERKAFVTGRLEVTSIAGLSVNNLHVSVPSFTDYYGTLNANKDPLSFSLPLTRNTLLNRKEYVIPVVLEGVIESVDVRLGSRSAVYRGRASIHGPLTKNYVALPNSNGIGRWIRIATTFVLLLLLGTTFAILRSRKGSPLRRTRALQSVGDVAAETDHESVAPSRFDAEGAPEVGDPGSSPFRDIRRRWRQHVEAPGSNKRERFSRSAVNSDDSNGGILSDDYQTGWTKEQFDFLSLISREESTVYGRSRDAELQALLTRGCIEPSGVGYRITDAGARALRDVIPESLNRAAPEQSQAASAGTSSRIESDSPPEPKGPANSRNSAPHVETPAASQSKTSPSTTATPTAVQQLSMADLVLYRYRNLAVLLTVLCAQLFYLAFQVATNGEGRLIRSCGITFVMSMRGAVESIRQNTIGFIEDYFILLNVREQNRKLKADNDRLRMENTYLREHLQTAEYTSAFLFQTQPQLNTLTAHVVGNSTAAANDAFFIDRGSTTGLKKDMAVITPEGIVGRVIAVYPFVSEVLLITDPTFKIAIETQKGHVDGVLDCEGGKCSVKQVQNEEKVSVGEWVFTSGEDRVFPRGLPIGTVVSNEPGLEMRKLRLKLSLDYRRLEQVLVILQGFHPPIPVGRADNGPTAPDLPRPPNEGFEATIQTNRR